MPDISHIRNINLKIIFITHFIFTSLSAIGFWSSTGYLYYNFILIILLIWGLYHEQSHEPLQLAVAVNGLSIFLDILLLIMGFPSSDSRAREKFSAAMAILHLIIRPFSSVLLLKMLEERSGSAGTITGLFSPAQSGPYEDIDNPPVPRAQAPPQGGYDFSSAQPI